MVKTIIFDPDDYFQILSPLLSAEGLSVIHRPSLYLSFLICKMKAITVL